jgi:hypothetical protein
MNKIVLFLLVVSSLAPAQWLNYPDPRTPRTKDGAPNLTAAAPRVNGKIDFSGVWEAERTPDSEYAQALGHEFTHVQVDLSDISKYALSVFWDQKPEEEPLRPEAVSVMKQRNIRQYPHTVCLPGGVPLAMLVFTFKVIQTPQEIVMLPEVNDPPRQIYMDGRALPKDPEPTWMGYSVGRWEDDTLVVETTGFNERGWLDGSGHPRGESMRITERYRRRDFGHMDLEISFDDPKYYTRPFGFKTTFRLMPDSDILEYVCAENEKDRAHLGK